MTVLERILQMCEVLRTNYQSYAIENHRRYLDKGDNVSYHREEIEKLCRGENVDQFVYTFGKKYAKIIHVTRGGQKSAHAFVDLKTGDVYKSATWSAPAKGIRYNLMDDQSRQEMYQRADWAGSYLYLR